MCPAQTQVGALKISKDFCRRVLLQLTMLLEIALPHVGYVGFSVGSDKFSHEPVAGSMCSDHGESGRFPLPLANRAF